MKFILKILIFLVFFANLINSQWFQVTSGTPNSLVEISFGDSATGCAAGLSSTIRRTTNAGMNWNSQSIPFAANIYSIFFINQLTGFAGGESGRTYKTTNGGINWIFLPLYTTENISGIFFIDANTGYVAAWTGKIFKTTDAGNSWLSLNSGISGQVIKIHFANANTGFACSGGGIIIKTTNGGQNWELLTTGISNIIFSVFACTPDIIYACGDNGKILKSTNGGASWLQLTSGTTQRLMSIYFSNALTGTAAGILNTIKRTTDGGNSWLTQQSPVSGVDFLSVCFTSITDGYISGTGGTILKTTTGGFPFPSQPVLTVPANGATGISLTTTLDWDSVPNADTYNLQLAEDTLFTNPVIDTSLLINSIMTVPPGRLQNYTWYYWHVRGKNIVGYGPYSSIFKFRTVAPLPVAPNLLLPSNGASNVSLNPTFDWDSTVIASYYTLQASLDTSFSNPPVWYNGITQSFLTLTSQQLQYNSRYYWRVNMINEAGTSPWSNVFNFTTIIGPPAPPTLLSPPNGTIGVSLTPTMKWVEDISATSYQCQISSDSTFTAAPEIDTTVSDSNQVTIRPGILINIHNYFWRVRTTNPIATSSWSAVWKFFTLLSPPVSPQLFSPQNDTINVSLTPTLDWLNTPYAQTYRIQLATDSLFTTGSMIINIGGLQFSQYNISNALENNKVYYWRVNATNGAGTGPFSQIWHFRTVISPPVAAPSLIYPPNGATNISITPTLDWNDVFGTLGYQLLVTKDSLFNLDPVIDTIIVPSTFTVSPGVLEPTTTYYWKVRGYNIGGYGPFSVIWKFTTGLIGISQISNKIPEEFKLHNNYPNPFNPVTHIKFDIPAINKQININVKIIIYDLLGRQVTVLADSKLNPGYYDVTWNASDNPSGVYFIRIIAGEFTAVKKMVVLK